MMVHIKDIQTSNATFKSTQQPGLEALFVGATRGIGQSTLKQFVTNAYKPTVYVVGRSITSFSPFLTALNTINPDTKFYFIESEISLIRNVDKVCEEIRAKEKKLDVLFLSPGWMNLGGREETSEGIDIPQALRYYSRLRFTFNLLPLLNSALFPRVISIFGGGREKPIDLNDLEVRNNFSSAKAGIHCSTQTTLAFEELANSNPGITFIHKYPGLEVKAFWFTVPVAFARWVLLPTLNLFLGQSVEEAGERGLFLATRPRYPPGSGLNGKGEVLGTALPEGVEVAKASVVHVDGAGNGVYRVNPMDESAEDGDVLPGYRRDAVGKRVWEETQIVWERALARSS